MVLLQVPHKLCIHADWQRKFNVKVNGVFTSYKQHTASSRQIQFHWVCIRDSDAMVTPFMQVRNYLTMNFATLWSSSLQPPFTRRCERCVTAFIRFLALGRRQVLYVILVI